MNGPNQVDEIRRLEAMLGQVVDYTKGLEAAVHSLTAGGLVARVRELQVVNADGETVARIAADEQGHGVLVLYDRHGLTGVHVSGGPAGGRVGVFDASGDLVGGVHGQDGRGALTLVGPSGEVGQLVGPSEA